MTQREVAARLGVTRWVIKDLSRGRRYTHLARGAGTEAASRAGLVRPARARRVRLARAGPGRVPEVILLLDRANLGDPGIDRRRWGTPSFCTILPFCGTVVRSTLFGMCSGALPKYHGLHRMSVRKFFTFRNAWLTLLTVYVDP